MRIVFMGTPDFAKKSLEAIYKTNNEVIAVITNPDKPKGRGMKMIASPVKEFAIENNIKVFQPIKIRNNEEIYNDIKSLKPDLFCVVAYGKILPKEFLDIPKYGSVNVHGSLLPKYRGAAPIQWAVINGEKETGITTMLMDEGMDTGDILLTETVKIGENETTGELWEELSTIGGELLVETVNKINDCIDRIVEDGNEKSQIKELINAKKQGDDYTMAPMLSKEISKIDWNKTSLQIHNLVRGLDPIMGAFTMYNDKKIKIWKTKIENNMSNNMAPGAIMLDNKKLFVKTGDGFLSILELQEENSKRMDIKSFLNGRKLEGKFE